MRQFTIAYYVEKHTGRNNSVTYQVRMKITDNSWLVEDTDILNSMDQTTAEALCYALQNATVLTGSAA